PWSLACGPPTRHLAVSLRGGRDRRVTSPYALRDRRPRRRIMQVRGQRGTVLSVTLLGPFQVTWEDRPVTFATRAARALLAYRAVEAERAHPRERLAALLWPEAARGGAAANLRQTLARILRALPGPPAPPVLEVTRQALCFRPGAAAVDAARFEALV